MPHEDCARCKELLDDAAVAILQHVRAVGQLESARLRRDEAATTVLEAVVREAGLKRENAVAEYHHHHSSHGMATSGAA
jgi:hypothetical protein